MALDIQEVDYLRERLEPKPTDFYYLSLSDLYLALNCAGSDEEVDLLDYGCGGSPYQGLFPNARYKRADFLKADDDSLDYALGEDSLVSEKDESFDIILSTQVAEHLPYPQKYFKECYRLLRREGRLICTTHGYFQDHGCPYDFQRWTSAGLRRDLQDAGFNVEKVYKLTTGSRAFFSVLDFSFSALNLPRSSVVGMLMFIGKKGFSFFRTTLYRQLDTLKPHERMALDDENKHTFYMGLMALGSKKK